MELAFIPIFGFDIGQDFLAIGRAGCDKVTENEIIYIAIRVRVILEFDRQLVFIVETFAVGREAIPAEDFPKGITHGFRRNDGIFKAAECNFLDYGTVFFAFATVVG